MPEETTPNAAPESAEATPSRRSFVKAAGAMAAAATSTGPLIRKGKAAGEKVQFGWIGPGSRGYRLLSRHAQHIPHGQCVAVCDIYKPNLDQAVELFGGKVSGYTDYRELLDDSSVEAVFITTPLYLHYPVMRDALEAGKHVFCEKSLVFTPEEIHGLRALHEQKPELVIQVGLQRRYSDFYKTAKELVDKGVIGDITHIQAQWHRNKSWRRKVPNPSMEEQINWRMYRKFSGGLCAELMSHQVDVADWMIGSHPEKVMGVGGIDYWKDGRDIYDNIQLVFEYPGGQKLQYSSIMTNRHIEGRRVPGDGCREIIMGTDGSIELTLIPYGEGMWFRDPMPKKMGDEEKDSEGGAWVAGATVADMLEQGDGLPIIPNAIDVENADMGFIAKEAEYAKRWLYQKGIMMPKEEQDPEYTELHRFLLDVRDGGTPDADINVGLQDSASVMLANMCMDEERKMAFAELDEMGREGAELTDDDD